jgi:CHAT domain-containing protein
MGSYSVHRGNIGLRSIELTTPRSPSQSSALAIRRAWVLRILMIGFAVAVALADARGAQGEDPSVLRDRAAATIEAFREHFRRTGDFQSKLPELGTAAADLLLSASGFLARGDKSNTAQCLIYVADIRRMQGQWDAALVAYGEAEALARQTPDRVLLGKVLIGKARAASSKRDYAAALALAREAVQTTEGLQDKKLLGDTFQILAEIQLKLGDFAAASDAVDKAMTSAKESGSAPDIIYTLMGRADIWWTLAYRCDTRPLYEPCLQQIEKARQDYAEARGIAAGHGWDGLVGYTDGFLREAEVLRSLYVQQNKPNPGTSAPGLFEPKAPKDVLVTEIFASSQPENAKLIRPLYEQAQRDEEAVGGFSAVVAAHGRFGEGMLLQMEGDLDGALSAYLQAVDLFESDRARLQDEHGRAGLIGDKLNFYYRPVGVLLEKRRYAEAFALLERSRARTMGDLLASRNIVFPTERERGLYADVVEQRARVASLQTKLFSSLTNGTPKSAIAGINTDIAKAEQAYQSVLDGLRQVADKKTHDLIVSAPATLEQLQTAMRREGFESLMYLVEDTHIILWHISAEDVQVRNVFIPKGELNKKIRSLQDGLTRRDTEFNAETARELYLFLVSPARSWIKGRQLVIFPSGELHQIPFEALQSAEDGHFLGEEFQISYAPSATVFLGLKPPGDLSDARLLAIADPAIPAAQAEVEAIAALYPGRATTLTGPTLATKQDVKSRIGDYDIVHLSVHGTFDPTQPLFSYLTLAPSDGDDGRLTAAEMFGLPLDRARLVVLSACETGKTSVATGDETVGMIRGLLFAGAHSFVLSRWKVDAGSTSLWMRTFYNEAQKNPMGEAARRATVAVRGDPAYRHPYFWAPFMLVGR